MIVNLSHGLIADLSKSAYPTQVFGFLPEARAIEIDCAGTLYGFVMEGELLIGSRDRQRTILAGEYFSLDLRSPISMAGASGFAALRMAYHGLTSVGGPVEVEGRLRYMDGCSDTVLIAPPLKGDPCFNLLHMPPGIKQTPHTHPSFRVGLIHAGSGWCRFGGDLAELSRGQMFVFPAGLVHSFVSGQDEGLTFTVFHPESRFGPTDQEHPMLNGTIVDGASVHHLKAVQ